jgi:hypothetical protein
MGNVRREIFIGLIAPIGIDLDAVNAALANALGTVGYSTNPIRFTDILREHPEWYDLDHKSEIERYQKYINAGDQLCGDSGRQDIMALYGIARLQKFSRRTESDALPAEVAHIFRQIKRVQEIRALREVYGRNILFLGCYSPRKDRVSSLVNKMLKNERGTSKTKL